MRTPRGGGDTGRWERTLARYLTANGIPLSWKGHLKGFTGIAGFTFKRIAPKRARYLPMETWAKMPEYWREHRHIPNMIVIVTNTAYGDDIEDSLVVTRLGTFAPILATLISSDRERYVYAPDDHG